MQTVMRSAACLLALVALTHAFYPNPPDPGFNPPDLRNFWDVFHSRVQQMEQAAHQNAAQLEGLLRRWVPGPGPLAEPPSEEVEEPQAKPSKARPTYNREPVRDEDEDDDDDDRHFDPTRIFGSATRFGGFDPEDDDDDDEDDHAIRFGVGSVGPGFFQNPHNFFKVGLQQPAKPWWQGPNVCVARNESEEVDKDDEETSSRSGRQVVSSTSIVFSGTGGNTEQRLTTCRQTNTKQTCTTIHKEKGVSKKSVVTHQCCHGFSRHTGKSRFCSRVKLDDLMTTARRMGAAMFAQSMEASGVDMNKMRSRNVTVFAPSDSAMKGFSAAILEQNEVEVYQHTRRRRDTPEEQQETTTVQEAEEILENEVSGDPVLANDLKELVLTHLVPGILDFSELNNDQLLYTENSKHTSIRMNMYPANFLLGQEALLTANCVPVRADATAENGVVAIVGNVLAPITQTLQEMIQNNPKLTTFKKVLERSEEWDKLSEPGHWTVFAPTEDAFKRLPGDLLKRLLEGEACVDNVARHHVVEHTVCSSSVRGDTSTVSVAGEPLRLSRGQGRVEGSEAEEVHVESAVMVSADMVATNGVLHLVDAVLMPKSARTLSQALADRGLSSLVKALGSRGLLEQVDGLRNVTLFAPSESALRRHTDKELSKETLLYHVTDTELPSCEFQNNMTLQSHLERQALHLNLFKSMPTFGLGPVRATVQCARVVNIDELACGAVLHELDRVMSPPVGNVLQTLEKRGEFSILLELIKGTRYETRLAAEDGAALSLLAPTDEVMKRLTVEQLEKLREDKDFRENVISKHVINDVICCEGVAAPNWPFTNHVLSDFGTGLPLNRGPDGVLHVGPLPITQCDIMATNGVIHAVNGVRVNPGLSRRGGQQQNLSMRSPHNPNVEVKIFGL